MSPPEFDWIVVGSGFGGSVSALRLAEKGYRVLVLEEGRRFADQDFARSAWELHRLLWAPALGLRGIMRVRAFRHVIALAGAGVGGGSLVYGATLYRPHSDAFYEHPQWAACGDWRAELAPHYAQAERMLGATDYVGEGPSEQLMHAVAKRLGVPQSFHPTRVGVFLGEPGVVAPDPYFGGRGPARRGCLRCGQCMLGCRHGAKNTLEKNYLHLAERHGAVIKSNRRVLWLSTRDGIDGRDGYVVHTRPAAAATEPGRTFTAAGVIVSAGALGTNELLHRCRRRGALPRLSARLGRLIRTNSESITAVSAPAGDLRGELAITASIHPDAHTHITNNSYGSAGDALALAFRPLRARRIRGWSRRSVVLTTMRTHEEALSLRATRPRGRLQTVSTASAPGSQLAVARQATEIAASLLGGVAHRSIAESLTGRPTTAHLLGGAAIGASAATGVIDARHQVFGYRNLLICDGSAVPANPGVNPSLTIAAMTERAMSFIDDKERS